MIGRRAPAKAGRACRTRVALAITLVLVATPAAAREDGAPAGALGAGDAIRASAVGVDGLFFNPAGMSLTRRYSLGANYGFTNDIAGHAFGASAVDSASNEIVALGIAWDYILSSPGGLNREGQRLRGGLSAAYRTPDFQVMVGAAAHYVDLERKSDPESGLPNGVEFFTIDAGLLFGIGQNVRVGVVGQNLIATQSSTEEAARAAARADGRRLAPLEGPRKVGFGAAVDIDALRIAFDTNLDLDSDPDRLTPSYHVGLQYLFEQMVVVRLGFVHEELTGDERLSAGLGYTSTDFAIDLSYSQPVVGNSDALIFATNLAFFLPN